MKKNSFVTLTPELPPGDEDQLQLQLGLVEARPLHDVLNLDGPQPPSHNSIKKIFFLLADVITN
jgi:hypothetical protein